MVNDCDYSIRIIHLRLLNSCSTLLVRFIPLGKANTILSSSSKNVLANSLLDFSFARLYPSIHETLYQFVKVSTFLIHI